MLYRVSIIQQNAAAVWYNALLDARQEHAFRLYDAAQESLQVDGGLTWWVEVIARCGVRD